MNRKTGRKPCGNDRVPLPEHILAALANPDVSRIERVQLAEKYRELCQYTKEDMFKLTGIGGTNYYAYVKLIDSGRDDLFRLAQTETVHIRMILKELTKQGLLEKRTAYLFADRLNTIHAEILYQSKYITVYRDLVENLCCVGVAKRNKDSPVECIYLIDDKPFALETVLKLLNDGVSINFTGNVTAGGKLWHHILSAYSEEPLETVRAANITFVNRHTNTMRDIRVSNITCPDIPLFSDYGKLGYRSIHRIGDQIRIFDKRKSQTVMMDYTPWMYQLLIRQQKQLRPMGSRLALRVGNRNEYLYHIVMMAHLYGTPPYDQLQANMERFRVEYLSKSNHVDHLNSNPDDNRLCNLMLMPKKQHDAKTRLTRKLRKYVEEGSSYFCWQKRHSNIEVKLEAGWYSALNPHYMVEGVFIVDEYIEKLKIFVKKVENEIKTSQIVFEEIEK